MTDEAYAPDSWAPTVDANALAAVVARCRTAGLAVQEQRSLGPLTTLGVGGPAAAFLALADEPAVVALARALGETTPEQVPLFVLGKGSNTLIADRGFPGLVVRLGAGFKWLRRSGDEVEAGAAEAMPALAAWAAAAGLAGLEFAAGIPATVGGSVRMNSGAHGGETAGRLIAVTAVRPGDGASVQFAPADLGFAYRRSALPSRAIVVAARWRLTPGEPGDIRRELDGLRAWRRAAQPLRERNCGSVFTNPPGDSAGRLIERAGLKGFAVGGARVSDKHANFIVVDDTALARDVYDVIAAVRQAVQVGGGPLLHLEARLIGDFSTG